LNEKEHLRLEIDRRNIEIEQKTRYITMLEKQLAASHEKLMVLLDPVAFNQYKHAQRTKQGPVIPSPEEKNAVDAKIQARKDQVASDIKEMEVMGIF